MCVLAYGYLLMLCRHKLSTITASVQAKVMTAYKSEHYCQTEQSVFPFGFLYCHRLRKPAPVITLRLKDNN